MRPRAASTSEDGVLDGWVPPLGFAAEIDPKGNTRLVISTPSDRLADVHLAVFGALEAPIGVLWRRVIDRADPKPNGSPPLDFVGLDLPAERVVAALQASGGLVWEDARGELWLRGARGEQVVLDADGVMYAYPDDPAFRDALASVGVAETTQLSTVAQRNYVQQWYHAECDAEEAALVASLGLLAMPVRHK